MPVKMKGREGRGPGGAGSAVTQSPRRDKHEGCTVHVGGVGGFLETPLMLREHCEDHFGPVLACTVRIRHGVVGKTSWALVTYTKKEFADTMVMVMGDPVNLDPNAPGNERETAISLREKSRAQAYYLSTRAANMRDFPSEEAFISALGPIKTVDRLQVMGSVGSMGSTMRKHQEEVEKEMAFQARRIRAPHERYADAVLASRQKLNSLESGYLVVLKDLELQDDPHHRGWDVRVRPKDRMSDLMKKIRERIPSMSNAEGIVRMDGEVQKGLEKRIITVRQMKHAKTYLIMRRAAPLNTAEAFELAMRFRRDDDSFKFFQTNGAVDMLFLVLSMQRIWREKQGNVKAAEHSHTNERLRAGLIIHRSYRRWMAKEVYRTLLAEPEPEVEQPLQDAATAKATAAAAARSAAKWRVARSKLKVVTALKVGASKQPQQKSPAAAVAAMRRKNTTPEQRWDKVRAAAKFRSTLRAHLSKGDVRLALAHIRMAQAAVGYSRKVHMSDIVLAAEAKAKADAAAAAANQPAGRMVGASGVAAERQPHGTRLRGSVVANTMAEGDKESDMVAVPILGKAFVVEKKDKADNGKLVLSVDPKRVVSQRERTAQLAKPIERPRPPARPQPMSKANYVLSSGGSGWMKPVSPAPVPSCATESVLLSGPSPKQSPRQRRAPLTPQQVLARRGYLTPRDLQYIGASSPMLLMSQQQQRRSVRPHSAAAPSTTATATAAADGRPDNVGTPQWVRPASASAVLSEVR
jgi:hypothetical protein